MITVGLVSLGCAKNLVDSEVMLGRLRRRGFHVTFDPDRADVVVVNTCGFLQAAKDEGYETIREMARLKDEGRLRRLVVAGCMVQRFAAEMRATLPEVDRFLGLNDVERIVEACDLDDGVFVPDLGPAVYLPGERAGRLIATTGASAYLKIAEGCDNPCSFCIIPGIRGAFRSRSIESLVQEARGLAAAGVREINLIAQDSTSYGSDLGDPRGLPGLLRALGEVEGLRWIRLLYAYPSKVTTRLMDAIAETEPVVKYVDLPLQHAAKRVLARMRRGGSGEAFLRMLAELRRRVPGIALRTTFIVGFPGETEDDVDELARFVEEAEFDHLGVFTYSHEPGTASHELPDDVPAEAKQERRARIMEMQQGISLRRYSGRIGRTIEVLVDGGPEEAGGPFRARAAFQAPDIDGSVLVKSRLELPIGEFITVRVTGAEPYDLLAVASRPRARVRRAPVADAAGR
ncbi:MAG TPA: 30S ribosomal protein S12 methylthiotransferase RimO [Candidatus Polarisedimenticolia bacterium]|nr:30S ribosomal protein S12 methylthiotransferase RimO [Candidatus Polarisedimenticolia bacterium]